MRGRQHQCPVPGGVGAGDDQQEPRVPRQRRHPHLEAPLDPAGGRRRRGQRETVGLRQLDQGERVPVRLREEAVTDPVVEGDRLLPGQQRPRVGVAQAADREPGELVQPWEGCLVPGREHDRDGLGCEAPREERQRPGRGAVQPLGIVDEAQQRPWRRGGSEQLERGEADAERVRCAVRQPERDPQGVAVGGRQRVEVRQRRHAQLVEPRERQVGLELRPGGADDLELLPRRVRDVVQQRALADARFAAEHERAAVAPSRRPDDVEETGDLVVPADECVRGRRGHGRTLEGRCRGAQPTGTGE